LFSEDDIEVLRQDILAAALDPSKWEHFLATLGRISGGTRTHFFGHDMKVNHSDVVLWSQYDPTYVKLWIERFGLLNAWAPALGQVDVGIPVATEQLLPRSQLVKTEFYSDWVRPQENITAGGAVLLFKDKHRFYAIGSNIRAKDADRLEKPFLTALHRLAPSLRHALEVNRAIAGTQVIEQAWGGQRSHRRPGLLLIGEQRNLLYASAELTDLLDGGQDIFVDSIGKIRLRNDYADRRLAAALRSLPHLRADEGLTLVLGDNPPGQRLICRLSCFDPTRHVQVLTQLIAGRSAPCLAVVISFGTSLDLAIKDVMASLGLSQAEAEICIAVAESHSLEDISIRRSVSIHTVRNQLKSAMGKANVRSQAVLVRLILDIAQS
jgi:DNA-binding CsgD family transcriptional regulator